MTARWWWVGYTDESKPKGQRALGAVIIKHEGRELAVAAELVRLGVAPRYGLPVFGEIDQAWGDPPDGYAGRLLDAAEAQALAKKWDPGHGGLAGPDDIKGAFEDDEAPEGSPLFKPSRGKR